MCELTNRSSVQEKGLKEKGLELEYNKYNQVFHMQLN